MDSSETLCIQCRYFSKKVFPTLWLPDSLWQSLLQRREPFQHHFQQLYMCPCGGVCLLLSHYCTKSATPGNVGCKWISAGKDTRLSVWPRYWPGLHSGGSATGGGWPGVDGDIQRLEWGICQQWGWQHLLWVPALFRQTLNSEKLPFSLDLQYDFSTERQNTGVTTLFTHYLQYEPLDDVIISARVLLRWCLSACVSPVALAHWLYEEETWWTSVSDTYTFKV